MTSPARKALGTGAQDVHQVYPVHASPRSLCHVALVAEHDARPVVAPGHPARHDAHHAGVPCLAEKHDPRVAGIQLLDHLLRLLGDLALDVLALAVERVQLLRGLAGETGVVGEQKVDRERGVGEAARRVDPRAQPE